MSLARPRDWQSRQYASAVTARRTAVADIFTETGLRVAAFLRERRNCQIPAPVPCVNRELRVHEEEGVDPPPQTNEKSRAMEVVLGTERFKWVAIGCDPSRNHGRLTATSILADTLDAASDTAPAKASVINGAKSKLLYGYMSNCTSRIDSRSRSSRGEPRKDRLECSRHKSDAIR